MIDLGDCIEDNALAPYPGLRPFEPHEASIFCGREMIVDEVIAQLGSHNLVLVHGGSGCGKSSLVRAGVLPFLARRHALAGKGFAHAVMRPSEGPLGRLAALLANELGAPESVEADGSAHWWSEKIIFDRDIVALIEERIEQCALQSFVLIVDQFEEIFPWARDRGRSDVELLVNFLAKVGAPGAGRRLFVMVTMRSDYLGQCAQFDKLGHVINNCQYFLRNMDDASIGHAITDPAAMFNGAIDGPLASRLLFEAAAQSDPLPVLQHSLMRMAKPYLGMVDWKLTLDDLERVITDSDGRESNALSVHANEVLRSLSASGGESRIEAARWIFRALLEVDVGGKAIRRPCDFQTLVDVSGLPAADVNAVVEAFRIEGVNLLTVSDNVEGMDKRIVDFSHEALLRNWDRMTGDSGKKLPGWVQEEFDDALTWRMLARYATDAYAGLDTITINQVAPFIANMTAAPERARRYLLRSTKQESVRDEMEWQKVEALIKRSRMKVIGWIIAAILLAAVGIGATIYIVSMESRERARVALDRNTNSAGIVALRSQRQLARLEDQLLAAPGNETAQQQQQMESAPVVDSSAEGATGFIWTGDETVTNLQNLLGQRVNGNDTVAGRAYVVTQPIKLRISPPLPPNISAGLIGALPRNTPVIALAQATQAPNGQFWLRVQSVEIPTVYIQYQKGSDTAVAALRRALAASNFIVPGAERLPLARNLREVRHCHAQDAEAAAKVATAAFAAIGGAPLRIMWIGKDGSCRAISKAGTIELWLGTLAAE